MALRIQLDDEEEGGAFVELSTAAQQAITKVQAEENLGWWDAFAYLGQNQDDYF